VDVDRMTDLLAAKGRLYAVPDMPTLPDGKATYEIVGNQPAAEELVPIQSLHDLYNSEFERLKTAYEGRERARIAHEVYLKAHPPQPKDFTLHYWRTEKPVSNEKGTAPMKRRFFSALGVLFLAPAGFAVVDTNTNGLSDLWENRYNNGDLFPETFDSQADPDSDGWTNAQEAAAGTDPFDPNPPDGHLRPLITHIPAVWEDTNSDGIPDTLITPEALTLTWPTIAGKQVCPAGLAGFGRMAPGRSGPIHQQRVGCGIQHRPANSAKLFWRVKSRTSIRMAMD
jgi:hypothetical protein